ncbi:Uncharacterised protein [Mycobacterium tuberculosis]|nr:Uncharacterised protein [Mycobacterium tuberculosis]COW52326.1 Uncharacterised protein [Mycobacterium tuberculosis]
MTRSSTSQAGASSSSGTATKVAAPAINVNASSAMSRNTMAGSAPASICVPMSRVASIHASRVRDSSKRRALSTAIPAAAASACTSTSSSSLNGWPSAFSVK